MIRKCKPLLLKFLSGRSLSPSRSDGLLRLVSFVDKYWLGLVIYSQASTYRCLCCVKKQSLFAISPKLEQHFECYTAREIFEQVQLFQLQIFFTNWWFSITADGGYDSSILITVSFVFNPHFNMLTESLYSASRCHSYEVSSRSGHVWNFCVLHSVGWQTISAGKGAW